jgi:2-keto-4-pentenoate hydratase/2-oxohepta-3-ene-1,7-dioic acid hydratase in catechol pathway
MVEAAFYKLFKGTHPKVLCVGKNYLEHVKEMGGTAMPAAPVIFMKPLTSIQRHTTPIIIPKDYEVHHERKSLSSGARCDDRQAREEHT